MSSFFDGLNDWDRDLEYAIYLSLENTKRYAKRTRICNACTYENSEQLPFCEVCSSSLKEMEVICDTWACSKCTYVNGKLDFICVSCNANLSTLNDNHQNVVRCGIPGCNKLNTSVYGFCSKSHKSLADRKGILSGDTPGIQVSLAGPSGDFCVQILTKQHPQHFLVKKQFLDAWKKPLLGGGIPHIMTIYKLQNPPNIHLDFMNMAYNKKNVQNLFHGTGLVSGCTFATSSNPSKAPCNDPACRVCSICQKSFLINKAGSNTSSTGFALRYGKGIYFSSCSSKSNDYADGSERINPCGRRNILYAWRCMFLCEVAVGKAFVTTEGIITDRRMCPPPGYDSVNGVPGKDLNFDELVVYDSRQAVPSYLIVYTLPLA